MKTTSSFKVKVILCVSLFSFSAAVNSMILTFEGTYYSKSVVTGLTNIDPDPNFSPTTFQFQVDFDTSVKEFFYQSDAGTYTNPDENGISYNFLVNDTLFGLPTFSSSPFSSDLGSNITQYTDTHLYNWSSSSLNDVWDSSGGDLQNSGYRNIGFSAHFEFQPDNDYVFYAIEVGLNLSDPPQSLSEVRFASAQELISELESARDQGARWSLNEVGFFHQDSPERYGGLYSGSATLIAIDGVGMTMPLPETPISEPGSLALVITGFGLMCFRRRRSRISK